MRTILIAVAVFGMAASVPASAQIVAAASQASMDAVARGLVAQYEAALIRERRLADQREVELIAQYETRIRTLRAQVDSGADGALAQLVQARADYAASLTPIAARDPEVRQLVEGYQERLAQDIAQASPEQLAALQRFADGDQEEGFRQYREESERRSAARQRVAQAAAEAARRADAADARQLASLAETMRLNGRTTTAEVLALWERASELEPTHVESHVNRSLLAQEVGDLTRARAAAEAAVAHSSEPFDRIDAAQQLAAVASEQGDLAGARNAYEQALNTARQSLTGSAQAFTIADLSLELAGVQSAQRDFAGARQSYTEGIEQARSAVAAEPRGSALRTSAAWTWVMLLRESANAPDIDLETAEARLGDATAIAATLAGEDPSATNLLLTSVLLQERATLGGRTPDAATVEQIVTLRMQAVEANPNNAEAAWALAMAYDARAATAEDAGDFETAQRYLDEQVPIMDRLLQSDPTNLDHRVNALGIRSQRLRFLIRRGDLAGARAGYEQLLPEMRAVAASDPTNVDIQTQVADVVERLAGLQAQTGDRRAARASYEEAVAMRRSLAAVDASDVRASRTLIDSLDKFGRFLADQAGDRRAAARMYAEGVAIAERLAAAAPDQVELQADVLGMQIGLALSSRRQADIRRAVERMNAMRQQGLLTEADVTELEGRLRELTR